MKKVFLAIFLVAATAFSVSAQKFKPAPDFLKGEKKGNLVIDYSNVKFDGDSQKEQYKDKGKNWVEQWEGKRREANESSFIKDFNKELASIDLEIGSYPEAQYTLIVDVLDCDFGAFAGPMSVPAKIKANIRIVKTGSTETLSLAATFKESQNPYSAAATPVDFDRMFLAFGELAEEVGEKLAKLLKK